MPNYIELDLTILHMTAEAVYVTDGDIAEWVPKSLIEDNWDLGWDDIDKTKTLALEEWIAIEKGFV